MQVYDEQIEAPKLLEPTKFSEKERYENFRIFSTVDILFILRRLQQENSLITLYLGYGNSFFLTTILNINDDKKEIVIDYGTNEKISQQALQSKELIFVTMQNKIKIEFTCDKIKKSEFEGKNAFTVNIPKSLLRIQRRNSFRISTPTARPLKCIIPAPDKDKLTPIELILLDISCGGIGVIDQCAAINFELEATFQNCQIALPDIGTVQTTIKIKNTHPMTLHNGHTCQRAGCEFVGLPAKTEAMIQRYIVKQEQMRKAK